MRLDFLGRRGRWEALSLFLMLTLDLHLAYTWLTLGLHLPEDLIQHGAVEFVL